MSPIWQVAREDYVEAARAKETLTALRANDPVLTLREALREALAVEDYSAASEAQAALRRLRRARPSLLWRDELCVLAAGGRALWLAPGQAGAGASRLLYEAPRGATLQQPTWSADAELIACAEIVPGGASRVIVLRAADGSQVASATTPPVFFIYWAPDGSAVTYLHAARGAAPSLRSRDERLVVRALAAAAPARRIWRHGRHWWRSVGAALGCGETAGDAGAGSGAAAGPHRDGWPLHQALRSDPIDPGTRKPDGPQQSKAAFSISTDSAGADDGAQGLA